MVTNWPPHIAMHDWKNKPNFDNEKTKTNNNNNIRKWIKFTENNRQHSKKEKKIKQS